MKKFSISLLWSIFWPSWTRIRIRKTGTRYENVYWPAQARTLALETAVCFSSWPIFPAWPAPQLLWGLAQPTMAACFRCCCSEQLPLLWFSAVNYNSLFGSEQLVLAAVVRTACVSCCESDSCNLLEVGEASYSGAQQLGSAPAGHGIQCSCWRAAHLATAADGTALPATAA